jgi:hypothetical protein
MDNYAVNIGIFYSQFNNVIWSTWDDTDKQILDTVRDTGITVILNKKPTFNGDRNINYQFTSTLAGIEYFKRADSNIKEVIKVRSDLIVYGLERLLNRIDGADISFMYMYDKNSTTYKPSYYLDYWHYGMDFPADFIVHGNIDVMHNIFNFKMEYLSDIPPESIILRNYLKYRGYDNNFDFEYLNKIGIKFFAKWTYTDNFYSYSTKYKIDLFTKSLISSGCSFLY